MEDNATMKNATQIANNPAQGEELLQRLLDQKETMENLIQRFKDFPLLIEMAKAYFNKEYTYVPVSTIAIIVATILYVLSPKDIIPDYIPGIGKLDDVAMVGACLYFISEDIEKFKQWKLDNNK